MANQLKKKFIQDGAIDGLKLELLEGQSVKLRTDAGQVVDLLELSDEQKILLKGEEAALKSQVDAEQQRAEQAEQDLQTNINSEEQSRIDGDQELDSRLSPIEDMLEYKHSTVKDSNSAVYADASKGREDSSLREGWYYTNDGQDGFNKINWYFHDGQKDVVALQDFSGYAVMTFDDNSQSPIMSVYTFPTGTNDAASWYHSRVTYSGLSSTPEVGKKYLVYFGQEPEIHPELPRLEVLKNNSTTVGEQVGTEVVMTSSFGTNSIAPVGEVKFMVESLGVNSPSHKTKVKLMIHHATQEEFDSLQTQVDSLDGNFATDEELSQAVSSLQSEIDADVLVEKQRAESEESRIEDKVDQEVTDRQSEITRIEGLLSEEESRAIQEEIRIDSKIDQEILDRGSEITRVEGLVSDEETRASGEESRIEGKVDQEISDRQSEISRVEGLVSDEETARISDVQSLQNQISDIVSNTDPAALDSLTEIVSAFQSADSDLSAAITSVIGQHETELQNFKNEINPKVSTLESEMNSAEGRLDIIEGDSTVEGSIAKAQSDAQSYTDSEISSLQSSVSAEIDADVLVEKQRAEAAEGTLQSNIQSEESARIAADAGLQSNIDAEESARIAEDALMLKLDGSRSMEADLSMTKSEFNSSFGSVGQLNNGLLYLNRQINPTLFAGDTHLVIEGVTYPIFRFDKRPRSGRYDYTVWIDGNTGLDGNFDFASGVLSSTSYKISGLSDGVQTSDAVNKGQMDAAVQGVQDQIDALDGNYATDAEVAAAVQVEKERAEAQEAAIRGEFAAADGTLQDNIDAEESARVSADNNLQTQIDTEKGRIDAILDASEADKDSFVEIVTLINSVDTENDLAFAGYVTSNDARVLSAEGRLDDLEPKVSTLEGEMDSAEGRLDVLESVVFFKEKYEITATDIANGFITLSHTPEANSMSAFVDRLAIHEGAAEDYSISGTTMTFLNGLVGTGNEKLQVGDNIYVKYQYKA